MNSTNVQKPDSAEVRGLIAQFVTTLNHAVNVAGCPPQTEPLKFADVVRVGAFMVKLIASLNPASGGRLSEREIGLAESIVAKLQSPHEFAAYLLAQVESGAEDGSDWTGLPEAVMRFLAQPYNIRQLLLKAVREMIPPSAPGRKRKIEDGDHSKLLARAEQLRPAMIALGQILRASPKRSTTDALQFLQEEYPDACAYLLKYIQQLENLRTDSDLANRAKTPETRMRMVADAMAGAEFDISARYSIQLVQEARRAARHRAKRAALQKM